MIAIHFEGDIQYMAPLAFMFIANLVLIAMAFYEKYGKQNNSPSQLSAIHHIALLALVWGVFGTVIGLFYAFGSLSEMKEALPLQVIMGGLKVALITALYGMIIFVVSQLALLILRSGKKSAI